MPVSLARSLAARRAFGRAGFVPFIVAGDPSWEASLMAARLLASAGADILEVGVPFSDPVADGPVIQAAGQRALARGMSLTRAIAFVKALRTDGITIPTILFTYLNPIQRMGTEKFAKACAGAGVNAVLIVDLPAELAGETVAVLKKRKIEIVLLASPTTTDERLKRIGKLTGSTAYYVSRQGVTGIRKGLADDIAERLEHVRRIIKKPLLVGFGVAEPAQARALARHAAGVVVGSAIVKANFTGGPAAVRRLSKKLIAALEL
jgi:tryptophan synthase alpha chain